MNLTRIQRAEGSITPVYGSLHIPFDIARVYYLYDVPGGANRGGHAHKALRQLIVSAMGSFTVVADDGQRKRHFTLSRAYYGIYMPNMIWRELVDFSSGAICLVLASDKYDESEYIRNYDEFIRLKRL
ncbi:MAG: WxcM-like domain-containing protein [Nitrospirae bacterium]|nr:WxcM-like domain-containing protein [Nitrospirota bacterium]